MIINTILSLLSLLFLFILWHIFWKKYSIDKLREELFHIRADLFDFALKNKKIAFNSKIYDNFEILINGTIRYAHNINFMNINCFRFLNAIRLPNLKIENRLSIQLEKHINEIPDSNIKDQVLSLRRRYHKQIVIHLFRTSLIFFFYISVNSARFFVKELFLKLKENIIKKIKDDILNSVRKDLIAIEYQAELAISNHIS
ncbi:MAG: hypothetical protein KAT05_01755 [Spirochaetes bacterium]|nr:hypothetical protein [Spirochaetota bacterium]